jgi:Putative zinc-finger
MMEVHPSESRLLLALDRELDAPDLATIDAHVRTCAECRATWDRLARLSAEIAEYCRALPARAPSFESAPAPVPRPAPELVPVSTGPVSTGPVWTEPVPVRRAWKWPTVSWRAIGQAALVGAAAVLLVFVVWQVAARLTATPAPVTAVGRDGGASQHRQDMPLVSLPGATRDDGAQVARLGATGVAATPGPPPVRRARPRPAPVRAVAAPRAGPAQKPTYYWALPYSNGALSLSEGSVVMTVRLSRDQLRLAGIPVNAMQPVTDQPWVRAKVLVGADGLPRAIALDQD